MTILLALIFLPTLAFAAAPAGWTGWNQRSQALQSTNVGSAADACSQLLPSDQSNNILKPVLCNLINIVALSVTNFASDVTCSIQKLGLSGNYNNVDFTPSNGQCTLSQTDLSPAQSTLTSYFQIGSAETGGSPVATAFGISRTIMTVIALAALLFFAFARILSIDISSYQIKKILPLLVVALVAGWLSIYIIYIFSLLVDFLSRLSFFSPYQAVNPMLGIFGGAFPIQSTTATNSSIGLVYTVGQMIAPIASNGYNLIGGFIGSVFLIIPSIVVFIFEYVLALRPLVVGILTAIAPIAFGCIILPQTQVIFQKWWKIMLIAIFYAPIVNFTFYLLNLFSQSTNSVGFAAIWLLKIAVIAFLIRLPFTIESDVKKISAKISRTSLGNALGMVKAELKPNQQNQPSPSAASDRALQTPAARSIIASAGNKILKSVTGNGVSEAYKNVRQMRQIPNLAEVSRFANDTNLARQAPMLLKSIADLNTDSFKAVIDRSDLQLWKDTRLIDQLKDQNGQTLDDKGAQIRADAARKLFRYADVVDQGKSAFPEVIKEIARKGALDQLPAGTVKRALTEGILTEGDLSGTYRGGVQEAIKNIMAAPISTGTTLDKAKELMQKDSLDSATGFKDLGRAIDETAKNQQIAPPLASGVVEGVLSKMESNDLGNLDKNGNYYLGRLGEVNREAKGTISDTLKKSGVAPETALSLAQNPGMNLDEIKKYVPSEKLTGENLELLRAGFVKRDLSNPAINEVSKLISSEKSAVSDTIVKNLSEKIKSNGADLDQVKATMAESIQKMDTAVSPDEIKKIMGQIDEYYPGAQVSENPAAPENVEKTKGRAKSVLEVIEGILSGGGGKETLANDPQKAAQIVKGQVNSKIQSIADGTIAADSGFNEKLGEITVGKGLKT